MTLPYERTRAVLKTREFLSDLLSPMKTPRVPREIRRMAGRLLKHYPVSGDMHEAARRSPEVFAEPEYRGFLTWPT